MGTKVEVGQMAVFPIENAGFQANGWFIRWLVGLCCTINAILLTACTVNPVTGQSELELVSTAQQIRIGEQQYAPAQQMQGGQYKVDPELSAYVQQVGQRLAAQSPADLPYEFVVLNNSVPNAWALPGGKIAINRGLLVELRKTREWQRIPVIFVTGHAGDPEVRKDMDEVMADSTMQGPSLYLEKPVTPHSYLAHICKILRVACPEEADGGDRARELREQARELLEGADAHTLEQMLEKLKRSEK